MDHCGDMIGYIQTGLELQGYPGILEWQGLDRYNDPHPTPENAMVDRDFATGVFWAKDQAFRVVITPWPDSP